MGWKRGRKKGRDEKRGEIGTKRQKDGPELP
jgi:hypothetical protein